MEYKNSSCKEVALLHESHFYVKTGSNLKMKRIFARGVVSKGSSTQTALNVQPGWFCFLFCLSLWDNSCFVPGVPNCTCKHLNSKVWQKFNGLELAQTAKFLSLAEKIELE